MPERTVFVYLPGETEAVPAGRLTMVEEGLQVKASRFAYGRRYTARATALPVDPVALSLLPVPSTLESVPPAPLALFGAIRDAVPDAWGRRVIENRWRAPSNGLQASVYLDQAGPHRTGALDVRAAPTSPAAHSALPSDRDLEQLLDAAARIERGDPVPPALDAYLAGSTAIGGARPKSVVAGDDGEWIAKFSASTDRFNVPVVEWATLDLARLAGLQVPAARLAALADGRQVLLVKRFDREQMPHGTARRHMVSALTLLALPEAVSQDSSYAAIADALSMHGVSGRIARDREELFARMVFNILVSNDDDHLRNHAFLFDPVHRGWRLSPLYDVVPRPQSGPDRTLYLSVGPQGRLARLDNALAGAGRFGLLPPAAAAITDRVVRIIRTWRDHFETLGVPAAECDLVASAFRDPRDVGYRAIQNGI